MSFELLVGIEPVYAQISETWYPETLGTDGTVPMPSLTSMANSASWYLSRYFRSHATESSEEDSANPEVDASEPQGPPEDVSSNSAVQGDPPISCPVQLVSGDPASQGRPTYARPSGWLSLRDFSRLPPGERLAPAPEGSPLHGWSHISPYPRTRAIYYPQTAHDAYHMAFLIRQVVVADLVTPILDYAEYWLRDTSSYDNELKYSESDAGKIYHSAHVPKLTAPRAMRKVEICIVSHDQGWSSYPQWHGTREGSWTWFEVEIPRLQFEREVCRNLHADDKDQQAVITWRYDSEDQERREMMRALRSGDVISVKPFARFPGWTNFVVSAKIDIFTNAVRRM